MRKNFYWLLASLAITAGILAACGGDDSNSNSSDSGDTGAATPAQAGGATASAASPTDLIAVKKTPGSLATDDPAWSGAPATTAKTQVIKESEAKADVDVKVQALYSDTDIWFRFQWSDASNNNDPSQWVFDGTKFTSVHNMSDRLGLYWEITPVSDFEARGCLALCHKTEGTTIDNWYMMAPSASDSLDLWQWTAASSAPVGQANDYSLTNKHDDSNIESSIVADPLAAGSGSVSNTNATKDGPKDMQDPAKTPSLGPKYLAVSEAVALDVTRLKAGDKIPSSEARAAAGDRADVETKTTYASGQYTVVFHRKLDTGNPDDAKFQPGKTYPFGLAVWDNLDQDDHTVTQVAYHLVLK